MAAFNVRLIRKKAPVAFGEIRRHVNGVAGHHMGLLLHLHRLVDKLGDQPDNPEGYAEVQQALSDLAGLHGVDRDLIHGIRIQLFEQLGGYNVGIVAITNESDLEARRLAATRGTDNGNDQGTAAARLGTRTDGDEG